MSLGLSELLPMETGVSGRATAVTLSISLFTAQTAGGASAETPGVIDCVRQCPSRRNSAMWLCRVLVTPCHALFHRITRGELGSSEDRLIFCGVRGTQAIAPQAEYLHTHTTGFEYLGNKKGEAPLQKNQAALGPHGQTHRMPPVRCFESSPALTRAVR